MNRLMITGLVCISTLLSVVGRSDGQRASTQALRRLSTEEIAIKTAFDAADQALNSGWGYTGHDNRSAVLANNEPEVICSYLRMYEATLDVRFLRKAVEHAARILRYRDDVAGFSDYRNRRGPVWSNAYAAYTQRPYAFVLESGLLTYPLAYFAAIVKRNPELAALTDADGKTFAQLADTYITKVAETIQFHQAEWHTDRQRGLDIGFYTVENDATFLVGLFPGKPVPVNFSTAMGRTAAMMFVATGHNAHLDRAVRIANWFLLEQRHQAGNNSYVWSYWPQMPYYPRSYLYIEPRPEDLNHSVISLDFVRIMYEYRLGVFYKTEMRRFSRTMSENLYRGSAGRFAHYVDGTGDATLSERYQVGRLSFLAKMNPQLLDIVQAHFRAHSLLTPPVQSTGGLESIAEYLRVSAGL